MGNKNIYLYSTYFVKLILKMFKCFSSTWLGTSKWTWYNKLDGTGENCYMLRFRNKAEVRMDDF